MKARRLVKLNTAITLAEVDLRLLKIGDPAVEIARERLRKAREDARVFVYKQKSFTSSGKMIRH